MLNELFAKGSMCIACPEGEMPVYKDQKAPGNPRRAQKLLSPTPRIHCFQEMWWQVLL